MILDYGLGGAQPAPLLVGFALLLVLAALHHVWTKSLDRKYQVYYPLLGNKESQDLREIVQTQWRQVALLCSHRHGFTTYQGSRRTRNANISSSCPSGKCLCFRITMSTTMPGNRNRRYVCDDRFSYLVLTSLIQMRQLLI